MNELTHWIPSALVIAAVLWRGGALTNKLDELNRRIGELETSHKAIDTLRDRVTRLEAQLENTGNHHPPNVTVLPQEAH